MAKAPTKPRKVPAVSGKEVPVKGAPAFAHSAVAWLRAHSRTTFLILVAIATIRIVSTYTVYSHTADELGHIGVGMEWLDKGVYQLESQHPPLARVAAALGPYLAGIRSQGQKYRYAEGAQIIYHGHQYDRNLSLARLGILPFFWIASLVVFLWARRELGDLEAVVATFLFTFLPPVLAHAGLATTDMALTAFVGAGFFTGLIWIEKQTLANSALFGACVGLAVLSKFSALPFLPVAMLFALVWYAVTERPRLAALAANARKRLLPFGLAVLLGALVVWAGYRFSIGHVSFTRMRVPVPELFDGIGVVLEHNRGGHIAYLLGDQSMSGWWYYYLVILAVKTPLPFLVLLFGAALLFQKKVRVPRGIWLPLTFSLGILVFSLYSRINIGVRHVLPAYIGFSLVAAACVVRLPGIKPAWATWAVGAMIVWMAGTSLFSHPEYLPYFNVLAGDSPEDIAVDSDLDWGQDMKRLGRRLQEIGAPEVTFLPFVLAYLEGPNGFGYPKIHPGNAAQPSPGWNAVSVTVLKSDRLGLATTHPEITPWPEKIKPNEKVGKGIWLYYFPPR